MKALNIILSILMLLCLVQVAPVNADAASPLYGDVDGSGVVDDWDSVVLKRYLAEWDVELDSTVADVDVSGSVDDWDSVLVDRYLADWDVVLGPGVIGDYTTTPVSEVWSEFIDNLTTNSSQNEYKSYINAGQLRLVALNMKFGYNSSFTADSLGKRIALLVEEVTGEKIYVGVLDGYDAIFGSYQNNTSGVYSYDLKLKLGSSADSVIEYVYARIEKDLSYTLEFDVNDCAQEDPWPDNNTQVPVDGMAQYGEIIPISTNSATQAAGNGIHSGHQTRIVYTEHGIYSAYVTNTQNKTVNGRTAKTNTFTIFKIQNGQSTALYSDDFPADSSSVNIMQDTQTGDVYVAAIPTNKYVQPQEPAWLAMYRVDAETDEITKVFTTLDFEVPSQPVHGYGYSQPIMDVANRKIYALYSGGDGSQKADAEKDVGDWGYFAWAIYDMESGQWEDTMRTIRTNYRFCYHYAYADGNGGISFITQRDVTKESVGHSEISHAKYVWDELDLFVIPNMYEEEYEQYVLLEADYSQIGENKYPESLHYEYYKDDDGLMHVLYMQRYYRLPSGMVTERTLYHAVYDGTELIYHEKFELQGGETQYAVKMGQTDSGLHYIVAIPYYTDDMTVQVWTATDEQGLHYELDSTHTYEGYTMSCNPTATGPRSLSTDGNDIHIWFANSGSNGKYDVYTFTITME